MALLMLTAACGRVAFAQEGGVIQGRVVDASGGAPLAGALVRLEGTALSTPTDAQGAFRLTGVPAGARVLLVTYLGRKDASVTLREGESSPLTVALEPDQVYRESVTVVGQSIQEGQARALNQQKTALNITNIVSADQIGSFPDPNAAEAASRVPGVSISRDQGEGRYVLVRGTEPRLNSMMIDGERIPAPEGDARQVALDAVPADQLQSIEVSKAVTPDMDADSIGGAVNLLTKQAVSKPTALFSLGGGYNALQRSGDQQIASGTFGRRFNAGKVGLLAGFSASSLVRGSENFEAEYDGNTLNDLQLRDYQIDRNRYGFNASGDVRLSGSSSIVVRAIVNRFEDYEVNNRIRFRPPNRRIEHVLKNRNQNQNIRSLSMGARHVAGGGATLDYRLAYAFAEEIQPDRLDSIFRQTNVDFAPSISDPLRVLANPSVNNAANARLNAWETEIFDTQDRDWTGSANLRMPLGQASDLATFLKAGAKFKDKRKFRNFEVTSTSPASAVLFPQLQDAAFDNSRFLDFFPAGYPAFPGINADASRALFNSQPASRREVDYEGDASTYDAGEQVAAGYVMAEIFLGSKLTLLPGVRVESTKVNYTGNQVLYDDGGDYASTSPVTGGDRYTQVLPGFHLKYALDDQTNVRTAYTRTLARPNYVDLVPYELVFQEDGEITRGNSALKPTTSDNLDVLFERYFTSVGVVSGGIFFKRLTDYIFPFRFQERAFGDLYQITQPRNGDAATLWGAELAFQNQLRFLPKPFDGIGVYANYTMTDSTATFPDRTGDSTLPGQSRHLGNLSLWYEKSGFSGKASWNFHGKYIDQVGASAAEDVYYDNHTQLDVNISQRVFKKAQIFADFLNLTNAPLRYYIGITTRPIQEEYYRWWSRFGVRVNW
ncbi:MAG: TonB-dependent receptor [Vicinamibacterales bacterium]